MSASTGEVPGRIFMTYRREDTAYPAAWLFDRLAGHFGRDQVFKDIDSIELGDDFVEVITAAVGSCDALLALIGDRWLSSTDRDGQRRLDDPGDFVRLEIEAALARDVRVIPILVGGAQMPRVDELPGSLAKLARRQALELSPARFDADTRRLLRVLDRTIAQAKERARQDAEAEAERRRRVGQLQQRIRDRAAARDWDAVVAAGGELAAFDPAAADPDGLAGMAREQIARRQEAEPPAVGAQQPADDRLTRRGDSPPANAGPQGLTPAGQVVAEPDADLTPSSGVVDRRTASKAGSDNLRLSAREETPRPATPAPSDPASVDESWWAAAPAVAKATGQPAGKPETADVSGRPPGELDTPAADTDEPDSTTAIHVIRAARFRFSIDWARLARQLRRRIVIVPVAAVLLVVVIGGFIAWQWTQSQYYVGANSRGEVTIYRGVNQQIAGISLSSPYQATGIQLAQVPTLYQQTLRATDAASSLSEAQAIVANVRSAVIACRQQYLARKAWVTEENAYQLALAQARSEHKSTSGIAKPGPQPAITGSCPPSTAFGIAASDLVPAGSA